MGLLVALSLAGCMATVGVDKMSIPPDAPQTCARHCQSIGMQVTALAIMAENVGCVCQFPAAPAAPAATPAPSAVPPPTAVPPPNAVPPAAPSGAAGALGTPVAGMATITVQQAAVAALLAQRQIQQQQRQEHRLK
jgi:hypothetical protein